VRRGERRETLSELRRALGPELDERELRRIARRAFEFRAVRGLTEVWPSLQGFAGSERCRIEGLERLDAALERGNGALLLTTHFGYGRSIRHLLNARGYTVRTVGFAGTGYRVPSRFTRVGRLFYVRLLRIPYIPRKGVTDSDLEAGINLRPLLAALGRNEALLLTADGFGAASLRPAEILGRTLQLTPGVFSLARASGATVLPVFAVDSGKPAAGIRIDVCPAIPVGGEESVDGAIGLFLAELERYVRAYPHLWRWQGRYLRSHQRGRPGAEESWRAAARRAERLAR
jgi:lauroyl/myristoyl acyltransferase